MFPPRKMIDAMTTNAINETMFSQPVQPTASDVDFWKSVLVLVQTQLTALGA